MSAHVHRSTEGPTTENIENTKARTLGLASGPPNLTIRRVLRKAPAPAAFPKNRP